MKDIDCLTYVRDNLRSILKASNITPFKWYGNHYQCFFCIATYNSFKDLKPHMVSEHEGFYSMTILAKAVAGQNTSVKLEVSDIACKLCPEKPPDFISLVNHIVTNHKMRYERKFDNYFLTFKITDENCHTCMHCNFKAQFFKALLSHTHKMHNIRVIICDICGKTFRSPNLRKHIKTAHEGARLKCKMCDETFAHFQKKRMHEAKVHKINEFQCKECDLMFPSEYLRKRHMTKDHNKVEYRCEICNMGFVWRNHMVKHIQSVHTKECLIPCEVCGVRFDASYMSKHMICHSNSRPFECRICKKGFARKKTLIVHERSHNKPLNIMY